MGKRDKIGITISESPIQTRSCVPGGQDRGNTTQHYNAIQDQSLLVRYGTRSLCLDLIVFLLLNSIVLVMVLVVFWQSFGISFVFFLYSLVVVLLSLCMCCQMLPIGGVWLSFIGLLVWIPLTIWFLQRGRCRW